MCAANLFIDCYFKGRLTRKIEKSYVFKHQKTITNKKKPHSKIIFCSRGNFTSRFEIAIYSPIQKEHTSFFIFVFLDFKLVPSDSALNSRSENQTYFFEILRSGTENCSPTQKIMKYQNYNQTINIQQNKIIN